MKITPSVLGITLAILAHPLFSKSIVCPTNDSQWRDYERTTVRMETAFSGISPEEETIYLQDTALIGSGTNGNEQDAAEGVYEFGVLGLIDLANTQMMLITEASKCANDTVAVKNTYFLLNQTYVKIQTFSKDDKISAQIHTILNIINTVLNANEDYPP